VVNDASAKQELKTKPLEKVQKKQMKEPVCNVVEITSQEDEF